MRESSYVLREYIRQSGVAATTQSAMGAGGWGVKEVIVT